jgi:predicted molibdopterin-dependent oxidoreductase YjgC
MFRLLGQAGEQVMITLDDVEVSVPAGVSVAAALLYLDKIPSRHTLISGAARAPFCMMGLCFECVVEIDGVSQRACQRQIEAGMRLRLQMAAVGEVD